MKLIRTEDAVGHVLCHDITQIIRGVTKDAVFRKGHVVTAQDIPVLLSVGKEHLYVWEKDEHMLHEDEAAQILREICDGGGMRPSPVKEGKIELIAQQDGLLKVNRSLLRQINSLGEMMIAVRHGNTPVKAGDKIAGTRIIPLVIEKEKMQQAKQLCEEQKCGGHVCTILPYRLKKAGIITTGSEVYKGRIQDTFTPVVEEKLKEYGMETVYHGLSDDNADLTCNEIRRALEAGAEVVLCTGGMSVDPDDRTPLAIRNTGAEIISYGAPVLPGAMFLLAYLDYEGRRVPIMGLPGCVMYAGRTVFDLVLPRIAAMDEITAKELAALGEGGLCLQCDVCVYPNCGFGKGQE